MQPIPPLSHPPESVSLSCVNDESQTFSHTDDESDASTAAVGDCNILVQSDLTEEQESLSRSVDEETSNPIDDNANTAVRDRNRLSQNANMQLTETREASLASRSIDDSQTDEIPTTPVKDCNILLQNGLTEEQKLNVILNFTQYNPPSTYSYPTKSEYGKCRSFQHHYLEKYSWLGYSAQLDGCLCLPCCFFASSEAKVQNFVQQPYCNWTKFNDKVKAHAASTVHCESVIAMKSFEEVHSGMQPSIDTSFSRDRQRLFRTNCSRLDAIIDCILLCGKQNIPLRGHMDADSSKSVNKGNFKAILEFRALGDSILQEHLKEGARNAQYTSPGIQNEIIGLCRNLILNKIGEDVKESGVFSIICDECTDCGNKEQLSLSVRYFSNEEVRESFLGFFELDNGVTGQDIADTIEAAIKDCHLDPTRIRGQAYDGASSMSGKYKGCAAILERKYPKAKYTHCCSHVLNLAVVKACSLIQVQHLFEVITKVYKFFDNHPKRQYLLDQFCEGLPSKVKSLCKTRWLQRVEAFHIFMALYDSIVKAFDEVVNNSDHWSRDSVVDANALSKAILSFEFLITLHVVERYMSFTENLTRSLQARAIDIIKAVQHIAVLKQVLQDARSGIETQFKTLFTNASRCAQNHNVLVSIPRRCSRQTTRENHPGLTAEEYYRRSLAVPFLDHLISEIDTRFTSHSLTAMRCLGIIPSCFSSSQRATDDEIIAFFDDDVDAASTAHAELQLWHAYFKDKELPDTLSSSIQHTSAMMFPNIRRMLIHAMVLPVTSCEAERSFSALRRIKNYLRTTMTQNRLNGLALLNIHHSTSYIPLADEVRDEFLQKNHRLMETSFL